MKTKKLAALGLASALTLSLASPAFASNTTKITGTYKEVPIAVTVPTTGTATINPYGLPIKVMSTDDTPVELASITGQKITTMPMAIYSKTEVGLLVSATVTGEVKGNLKLSAAAIPAGSTTNNALIYLETMTSDLIEANLAAEDGTKKIGPFDGTAPNTGDNAAKEEIEGWAVSAYDAEALNQILVGTVAKTKTGIGYLTAAEPNASDATKMDLQAGGAMWFRLAGDVVSAPKTPWTSKDGATVTVAFTFAPADNAGAPGEIKVPSITKNSAAAFGLDTSDSATVKALKFSDEATYSWELTDGDGNDQGSLFSAADGETASDKAPKITFTADGTYTLKLTVVDNNVPYKTSTEITVS